MTNVEETLNRVKIPNFGSFENALTELVGRRTLGRLAGHGAEVISQFDEHEIRIKLLDWIVQIIKTCHEELNYALERVNLLNTTERCISFNMPKFGFGASGITMPEDLDDEIAYDLLRPIVIRITFRLVRPTEHHAFKLVTVNLVMEEGDPSVECANDLGEDIKPANDDDFQPEDDADDEDDFDQVKAREDVPSGWVRYYTLHEDKFVPGKTRVYTNVDLVHNLTRHDAVGEMARILFGLDHVSIDDVDIEGQITVRTHEEGAKVVQGT